MRAWFFMLGGLAVWALHFAGVYGIASVADVAASADAPASRLAMAALTAACAIADITLLLAARRRGANARSAGDPLDRFITSAAGLSAGVSLVAVLWQGLPAALA